MVKSLSTAHNLFAKIPAVPPTRLRQAEVKLLATHPALKGPKFLSPSMMRTVHLFVRHARPHHGEARAP